MNELYIYTTNYDLVVTVNSLEEAVSFLRSDLNKCKDVIDKRITVSAYDLYIRSFKINKIYKNKALEWISSNAIN